MSHADPDGASAQQSPAKLSCRHLWKVYGGDAGPYLGGGAAEKDPAAVAEKLRADGMIPAAVDVSFDVAEGEIFVIMGLSGSGKSTVVRCLSRLVEPTHGEILMDGDNLLAKSPKEMIEIRRHKLGMVFQHFGLLPHLTVIDNIAFPLTVQGLGARESRRRVEKVISMVGLEGREDSYPSQLSGGQQQRVGIARSLATEPDLWLLDEPFSALDPLIRRQMQDEFLHIQTELKKSIVFITHDFLEALRIADRIMLMRAGRIVQIGRPIDLIVDPADDYVAEFTQDVPLTRVLTAADVVARGGTAAEGMVSVSPDTKVETLLPMLSDHPEGVAVDLGDRGRALVTPASLIDALSHHTREVEEEAGEAVS
ncbi:betaine/proline/choline family ABC transporter ATP-binding protein [Roseovarius salis]|uniref:quaternary amine ABC transporter ATP-binding protein n=1 Tax=Roseovarius salis TaxID=3376063 RepID=UPI0037C717F3